MLGCPAFIEILVMFPGPKGTFPGPPDPFPGGIFSRLHENLCTMHTGTKPSCIGTFRIYVRTERKSAKEFNIIFR